MSTYTVARRRLFFSQDQCQARLTGHVLRLELEWAPGASLTALRRLSRRNNSEKNRRFRQQIVPPRTPRNENKKSPHEAGFSSIC
ncbi:uncharacterized protein METZ01_LOCUS411674, partial [marine metagenome]